MLTYSNVPL